ncbi:MAG TPA: DUF4249 family protein [Phaeodactylibacter sp.]|nr:DUF4249 family protein [Phaeodactylibacter sp.]
MKKGILFLLLSLSFMINSCDNELELIAPWEDIPVVYGLLSRADEVHYIRVEKAFLDPKTSALEIAQNVDSLYYDEHVIVQLERVKTGDVFNLQKIDGATVGINREAGVFANSPNYLYKINDSEINLQAGEIYRLKIIRGEGLPIVTAETRVIDDYEFVRAAPANPIDFQYKRDITISWRSDDKAAVFFDLNIILYYQETDPNNPSTFIDKSLNWSVAKNIKREDPTNPRMVYKLPGIEFYQFLGQNIDGSQKLNRIFRKLDFVVTAGGKELFDYINVGQANTGITSSQLIPSFTNLSEGLGVFSSTNRLVRTNFTVSSTTRDSIRNGVFTKALNFQ